MPHWRLAWLPSLLAAIGPPPSSLLLLPAAIGPPPPAARRHLDYTPAALLSDAATTSLRLVDQSIHDNYTPSIVQLFKINFFSTRA